MNEKIIVVGGGSVGMAFALAAARLAHLPVTLIERNSELAQTPIDTRSLEDYPPENRIYAVSPAAQQFLTTLGAWPHIPKQRIANVRAMQVRGDDGKSEIAFDSPTSLATIIEHRALNAALSLAVAGEEKITVHRGVAPHALKFGNNQAQLTLADHSQHHAALLVAADGADSWVRQQTGIEKISTDYESVGIVANFTCEQPHGGVAHQWFLGDSVLAYLPLPGKRISIVWSVSCTEGERLKNLSASELEMEVAFAGHKALGALSLISPVAGFPLSRSHAGHWVEAGLALIGDAAHTLHPLAGQGVNLGFADAQCLAEVLATRGKFSSMGDMALLRKFERTRQESTLAIQTVTHQLRQLYAHPSGIALWLRNQGLALVNRQALVKRAIVDYAVK